MREHNRQAADDTKGTNRTAVQFNWLGTSCPPPPGRTTTPGPRPQRCPQRWLLHKALQLLIPGRFLAPTSSNHVASRADSNGIRCAGAEIDQPLFVSFNSWVLRMVQLVSVLSLPTQLNYCSDLLKAVLFGPCQRLGLHLTGSRGGGGVNFEQFLMSTSTSCKSLIIYTMSSKGNMSLGLKVTQHGEDKQNAEFFPLILASHKWKLLEYRVDKTVVG